jgi:superfamily II DNA or RNA helicase
MTSLSKQGYSIKKEYYDEKDLNIVRKELTVEVQNHMFDHIEPKKYKLYRENKTKLYLPKYYGLQRFGIPDRNVIGQGETRSNMNFVGSLRDYQVEQVNAFLNACDDPTKMGGIVSIGCGGGKTVIAINIACRLKLKTLFISHKDFLNVQFAERVKMFSPDSSIGIIKQNKVDIENKDFVVGSLQSIAMRDYDPSIFKDFGLVIIDEVHHCSAEVFSQALIKTCSPFVLGLSATLNRKDGLRKVFEWFIGKPVIKLINNTDDNDIDVKYYHFTSNNPEYNRIETMFNGKISAVKMLGNVVSYKPRIQFIVEAIKENMTKERQLLVLSERKALLNDIYTLLNNDGNNTDFDYTIGYYIGGMTQKKLNESAKANIILATTHMSSEGLDIPTLNSLILVSPMSDIEQSVGRILRSKVSDRIIKPLIIDIVDSFSIFINRFNKRKAYYKKKKYNIM